MTCTGSGRASWAPTARPRNVQGRQRLRLRTVSSSADVRMIRRFVRRSSQRSAAQLTYAKQSADTQVASVATGAMSYAFIAALTKYPEQSYKQLLNSIRDELRSKYSQKPVRCPPQALALTYNNSNFRLLTRSIQTCCSSVSEPSQFQRTRCILVCSSRVLFIQTTRVLLSASKSH